MMLPKRLTLLLLPLLVVVGARPGIARAQDEEQARAYFVEGKERYQQGRYEEALSAFKSAQAIRPSPILDYNIARCHDRLGQRREAVEGYERYLAATPNAANRAEVQARIAELKQTSEPAPPAPAPAPTPPVTAPGAPPAGAVVPPPATAEEPGLASTTTAAPTAAAEPQHEAATQPPPPQRRPGPGQPPPAPQRPDEGPFYKQWWFWVGCVAGVVIVGFVIGTAATRNASPEGMGVTEPPPTATGALLRF